MAYASHNIFFFLTLFLLLIMAEGAQKDQSGNIIITLGSSLFPTSQPTSWPSQSGLFAFGFYPAGDGFAVGIWLTTKPNITVVWTANRDAPPLSINTTLELTKTGSLLLRNSQLGDDEKNIVNLPLPSPAVSASMLDSGNFVIYNHRSQHIWESFSSPTDTILGGQNLSSGSMLISSVSDLEHSSGGFYLWMQPNGYLIAYPLNNPSHSDDVYWGSIAPRGAGPYVVLNLNLEGALSLLDPDDPNFLQEISSSSNPTKNGNVIYRATLDPDGNFRLYSHSFNVNGISTVIEWAAFQNDCQAKGFCGFNSYCSSNGTVGDCFCFPGFLPFSQSQKFRGCYHNFIEVEQGCARREPKLSYNVTDVDHIELGGDAYSLMKLNKDDCRRSCLDDCNCWAALYVDSICKKYMLPLLYGLLNKNTSATAFIKSSFSTSKVEQVNPLIVKNNKVVVQGKKRLVLSLAGSLGFLALVCALIAISSFFFYRSQNHRYQNVSAENYASFGFDGEFALQSFSHDELVKATNGFKEVLGKNSFGAVYKGVICEGRKAIAVKRVERVLEGERGFRAEVKAIAQTHHRNLVRLLGFCIEGAKKHLVYEFMSNGSLADLLFKAEKRPSLKERLRIALDVARGILYLHEECEACIIHCNIKPQNILFDDAWTAKITDFGLAKLLMPNQSEMLTSLRGTRGYLAPEWHKNTLISKKVDIYSFGVVLLEILCCRGNMVVNVSEADEILLATWVYNCFTAKDLMRLIGDHEEEVDIDMKNILERIVMVGLLCIHDDPDKRPSMKNVILMLEGTTNIPVPGPPLQLSRSCSLIM